MLQTVDHTQIPKVGRFARPARAGRSAADFVHSLPGSDFHRIAEAIVSAHRNGRSVILGLGAKAIQCGLNPLLIDLMRRRVVTAVVVNAAGAIHDIELAETGSISRDVAHPEEQETLIIDGGPGDVIHLAASQVVDLPDAGLGALLADQLVQIRAPYRDSSILVAGRSLNVPVIVRVPLADSSPGHGPPDAVLGHAGINDLRRFAAAAADLSGGVCLNLGPAELMTDMLLRSVVAAAPDLALLHDIVFVNIDTADRARSSSLGGKDYTLTGPHEIMLPLLAQALVDRLETRAGKVVDWDRLLALREGWRAAGLSVVWTSGCFDLLHAGHLDSLRGARALGDLLVVGVNSDASVRQLKGPTRPIVPGPLRAELLAGLECIDHVVLFDELTPSESLARLKPDIHCKGAEYAPPHGKPIVEAAVVESYGGRIAFLPMRPATSTTDLVERILQRKTV